LFVAVAWARLGRNVIAQVDLAAAFTEGSTPVSASPAYGLVGGSPILGLQLVGHAREFMEGQTQRPRDSVGYIPGRVGCSALKATDRGRVEVGRVCKGLLGESDLLAAQADCAAESDLWGLADAHP
jgi:hypothetical protein